MTAYQRFWKRHDVIGIIVMAGVAVNLALLLWPDADPPPEVVQRLQVAGATYELGFHPGSRRYNTVTRDGVRIFDSRERGVGLCLRLHSTPRGGVEAECLELNRDVTRRFPVAPG